MEKEKITEFTRRISQCNKGGLIVVMYDIFFAYIEDAKTAFEARTGKPTRMDFAEHSGHWMS